MRPIIRAVLISSLLIALVSGCATAPKPVPRVESPKFDGNLAERSVPVRMLINAQTGEPLSMPEVEGPAMELSKCSDMQLGKRELPKDGKVYVHSCAVEIGLAKKYAPETVKPVGPKSQLPKDGEPQPYNDERPESMGGVHQKST